MKLTILGKYGPYPAAGGACSGYLIEQGSTRVLIDCGNGVLSRLQQVCKIKDLSAIVLSHLHSDHMADMLVLRYALEIGRVRGILDMDPIPLYLPESPIETYELIASSPAFSPEIIKDGLRTEIGGLSFTFCEMTHPVVSYAMAVEDEGKRLVYTGDTNMNNRIADFAKDADYFVADAGLLEKDKADPATHLTAEEVGKIAAHAGVKNLILSHIWPEYSEQEIINEASRFYSKPIMAEEMKVYEL
jgi:ribonuclease BN (tRNA processing enzyme)